jgi:hypothetical protein
VSVVPFPVDGRRGFDEDRQSERLQAFFPGGLRLNELDAGLGTSEEWLTSAILHLKEGTSGPEPICGMVAVSRAAVSLVLMRIEELEHGSEPWPGNAHA